MRSAGENSIQAASAGTDAQKGLLLCMDSLSKPRNLLPVPSLPFYKQPDIEDVKIVMRKCLWRENGHRLLQKVYCLLLRACRSVLVGMRISRTLSRRYTQDRSQSELNQCPLVRSIFSGERLQG